jgi:hypothetical protein
MNRTDFFRLDQSAQWEAWVALAEIAALKARLAEAVHLLKGWSAYQASTELMAQTKALIRAADSASGDA